MITGETITEDEVVNLLKAAAARDQRTIGAADILAWYQDLNVAGIRYADASEAVARYYAIHWPRQDRADRFRLTSPVLIELVRGIREARHVAADFLYEPVANETGAQFAARLQGQLRAVGDGQPAAHTNAEIGMNPAGKAKLAELISGMAQRMPYPPEIADVLARARPAGSQIACPRCHAAPGKKCSNPATGKTMTRLHDSRIADWAILSEACPSCRAAIGEACRELGRPYRDNAHQVRIDAAKRALTTDRQEA
jgi:hypothetical protein